MEPVRIALYEFWGSFGIPAYPNTFVADFDSKGNRITPQMPYITYDVAVPPSFRSVPASANIYDYSSSFAKIDAVKRKISDAIHDLTGTAVYINSGGIKIFRGTPFMQDIGEDDINIRRTYINYEIRNLFKWI